MSCIDTCCAHGVGPCKLFVGGISAQTCTEAPRREYMAVAVTTALLNSKSHCTSTAISFPRTLSCALGTSIPLRQVRACHRCCAGLGPWALFSSRRGQVEVNLVLFYRNSPELRGGHVQRWQSQRQSMAFVGVGSE